MFGQIYNMGIASDQDFKLHKILLMLVQHIIHLLF
jgi:hypothetical protein